MDLKYNRFSSTQSISKLYQISNRILFQDANLCVMLFKDADDYIFFL